MLRLLITHESFPSPYPLMRSLFVHSNVTAVAMPEAPESVEHIWRCMPDFQDPRYVERCLMELGEDGRSILRSRTLPFMKAHMLDWRDGLLVSSQLTDNEPGTYNLSDRQYEAMRNTVDFVLRLIKRMSNSAIGPEPDVSTDGDKFKSVLGFLHAYNHNNMRARLLQDEPSFRAFIVRGKIPELRQTVAELLSTERGPNFTLMLRTALDVCDRMSAAFAELQEPDARTLASSIVERMASLALAPFGNRRCVVCGWTETPERHVRKCPGCRASYYCGMDCWRQDYARHVAQSPQCRDVARRR